MDKILKQKPLRRKTLQKGIKVKLRNDKKENWWRIKLWQQTLLTFPTIKIPTEDSIGGSRSKSTSNSFLLPLSQSGSVYRGPANSGDEEDSEGEYFQETLWTWNTRIFCCLTTIRMLETQFWFPKTSSKLVILPQEDENFYEVIYIYFTLSLYPSS